MKSPDCFIPSPSRLVRPQEIVEKQRGVAMVHAIGCCGAAVPDRMGALASFWESVWIGSMTRSTRRLLRNRTVLPRRFSCHLMDWKLAWVIQFFVYIKWPQRPCIAQEAMWRRIARRNSTALTSLPHPSHQPSRIRTHLGYSVRERRAGRMAADEFQTPSSYCGFSVHQ